MTTRYELSPADVRRRFDRAAAGFDAADFVHAHTRDGLFRRLEPIDVNPRRIIDLGSATGTSAHLLAKRFRRARVTAVDLSAAMCEEVEKKRGWRSRVRAVQADAARLPFSEHSTGLVFSNLLLPWIGDPDKVFAEANRVLEKNAVFQFSTLGPDSLAELGEAMSALDESPRINAFADMHDIGDGLVRAGLRDPVLDVDRLTLSYRSPDALFRDLTAAGARNALSARRRGLAGRAAFERAKRRLGESFTIELEIVYGHAWGSGRAILSGQAQDGIRIDAGRIPVRRR